MLGGKVSGDLLYFPPVWNLCSSVDDSMATKYVSAQAAWFGVILHCMDG
jgi:hypothetical protein